MMGSPFLGVIKFSYTLIKIKASALASQVYGTWIFISSPSKSALYGVQTHSLNLKVFHSITLTLCAIIDILCKDGYLLKITTSPYDKWRKTVSPFFN